MNDRMKRTMVMKIDGIIARLKREQAERIKRENNPNWVGAVMAYGTLVTPLDFVE